MNNREIEIDLRSLIIYIFEHWRSVVAGTAIIAILCGCFGIFRAYRANHSPQTDATIQKQIDDKQAQIDDLTEQLEELENRDDDDREPLVLTEAQKFAVSQAVDSARNYYSTRESLENSVFMKLDPDNLDKSELILAITPATNENLLAIKDLYKTLITSSEMISYVKDKTSLDISESRLVSVSDFSSSSYQNQSAGLVVRVIYTGEDEVRKITAAITELLLSKIDQISAIYGRHYVNVVSENVTTSSDYDVKTAQIDKKTALERYYYQMQNLKAGFIREQFDHYNKLLRAADWNTKEEIKSSNSMKNNIKDVEINTLKVQMETLKDDIETQQKKLGKDIDDLNEDLKASAPAHISLKRQGIKYGLIGIFLGMFAMAGLWAVIYIFRNRLDLYDDYDSCYGFSELGKVPTAPGKKEFIFDKWIRMWKYASIKHSEDEASDLIGTQISLLAGKDGLGSVVLAAPSAEFNGRKELEKLASSVKKGGGKITVLENILGNTENMNRLAKADGVVIVGKAGTTRRNDIYQLIALLSRQGVKVLGGVTVA